MDRLHFISFSFFRPETETPLTADDFPCHFVAKTNRIRASTATAAPSVIVDRVAQQPLSDLSPVRPTADEVAKIIQRSPAKQCQADPAPAHLSCKACLSASSILASIIAAICNSSLQQMTFPQLCKKAMVRPLLKKSTMNPQDLSSYRSISNLTFLLSIIEKVVNSRLSQHVDDHSLSNPSIQSAYRPYNSTKTAVVSIH